MSEEVLTGIRILSLEQRHALPWGTAFLADLGAEVIRIEGVDYMNDREVGPFVGGKPGDTWWNEGAGMAYYGIRNKKSLCLDVTHPAGKEVFLRLVRNSHVVTDNFRPGTMRRFGFDHESLVKVNPAIITLSCTGYGHTGPWHTAGARARTIDGVTGLSYLTGYAGGPSIRASSNFMDHNAGNTAAFALLLALYRRRRSGQGSRVDLSMQESGIQNIGPAILETQRNIARPRLGPAHLWKAPHNVYPCSGEDRWIAIVASTDEEWLSLQRAMGEPSWAASPEYSTAVSRWKHQKALDGHIGQWTAPQDAVDLMHLLQSHGVPAGAALTAQDITSDPHLRERGYLYEFLNPHAPHLGPRVFAGRPFRMSRTALRSMHFAALGEHNLQVLRDVGGLSDAEVEELVNQGLIHFAPRVESWPGAA